LASPIPLLAPLLSVVTLSSLFVLANADAVKLTSDSTINTTINFFISPTSPR